MRYATQIRQLRKLTHWLLSIATVIYFVTGLGITQFRVIQTITFGLLTKNLAFQIHNALLIPFIILLSLHILLPQLVRLLRKPLAGD